MELHDKTIAITGAAKGIGAATAIRLAGEGCIGEPDEIAKTVQFILENDYFSGRCIDVDGVLRL